jgi:hypothetical protein
MFNKKIFTTAYIVTFFFFLLVSSASAQMRNGNYLIELDPLSVTSSSTTALDESNRSKESDSANPTTISIDPGTTRSFTLSVSTTLLDFGELSPTNPIIRSQIFTITNIIQPNYSVTLSENHPLTDTSGNHIPDTTCDNGLCNEKIVDIWDNPLTFGFGYHCENQFCTKDFTQNKSGYKQLPDGSHGESAERVVTGGTLVKNKTTTLLYKVNVPASQPEGTYNNTANITLVPGI